MELKEGDKVIVVDSDYGIYGDFIGKKGKVLGVIQPEIPSSKFKPTRVSVMLDGGDLINFCPEDLTEADKGKEVNP